MPLEAKQGDRLLIRGRKVDVPDREAEILEVRGDHGAPPYLVRWNDDGREGLVFPGSDASIQRAGTQD
jgi:hypothetical protein